MSERESGRTLTACVEVDDTYLGGARCGRRGPGAAGKVPMVIGVGTHVDKETGEAHPCFVRLDTLLDIRKKSYWSEPKSRWTTKVCWSLMGWPVMWRQVNLLININNVIVGERKSSKLECSQWVNTLPINLKSTIQCTYHGFKFHKYAKRY